MKTAAKRAKDMIAPNSCDLTKKDGRFQRPPASSLCLETPPRERYF